jgi:hypothetical protein
LLNLNLSSVHPSLEILPRSACLRWSTSLTCCMLQTLPRRGRGRTSLPQATPRRRHCARAQDQEGFSAYGRLACAWLGLAGLDRMTGLAWLELGASVSSWALSEFLTRVFAARLPVSPFPFSHVSSTFVQSPRQIRWPPSIARCANGVQSSESRLEALPGALSYSWYVVSIEAPFRSLPFSARFNPPFRVYVGGKGAGAWWMSSSRGDGIHRHRRLFPGTCTRH